MKNENRMPGHSLVKSLPFIAIASIELFKNRPKIWLGEHGNVFVDIDEKIWGKVEQDDAGLKEFAMHRLYDFDQALQMAEGQIIEILKEEPFIPEDFGFELIYKPETIHDSPVRVYESKFCPGLTLHRDVAPPEGDHDYSVWTLMKKNEDGTFSNQKLKLPCHRIAYAVFFAMGVQIEPAEGEAAVAPTTVESMAPADSTPICAYGDISAYQASSEKKKYDELKSFNVIFTPVGGESVLIEGVKAPDYKEAISAAKFLVETDPTYGNPGNTEFSQYQIKY